MKKIIIAIIVSLLLLGWAGFWIYRNNKNIKEKLSDKKPALETSILPEAKQSQIEVKEAQETTEQANFFYDRLNEDSLETKDTDKLMQEISDLADDLEKDLILGEEEEVDFEM